MAFARVQGNTSANSGSANSIAVTISAVGNGNCVCGVFSCDNGNAITTLTVTDDKGNTYNVEARILDTTGNQQQYAFSRTNITNGPVTITATMNGIVANTFRAIQVDEFSGASTASADERDGAAHGGQFQATPGTGTDAISSGTFTTSTNEDLIWGGCVGPSTSTLASNGTSFSTGTQDTTLYSIQTEFRTQATAGSGTAATFTQAAATQRVTYMIAIKPAAGGAAPPNGWWRNESNNLPKPPVRFHPPPPVFVPTFRTAVVSGTGWHRDFPEVNPRPPIRFQPPPAFVSTFRTAVVSGIAFARSEPESNPRPARRFESPPAWNPRVITPVAVAASNGWFVNPEVLRKAAFPVDIPSTVLAPPTQAPRGWFIVPEAVKSRPVLFEQPIGFVSNFQTAGISGIAWMMPIDTFVSRRLILSDPSQVYAPQQQIVVAVVYSFMFPDVYKLRPVPCDDMPAFGRSVVDTSVIGWLNQPAQDRYGLNVRMDTAPALSLTPSTLPVPISGMAWFAPIENAIINRGVSTNTVVAWLPQTIVQIVSTQRLGVNRLKTIRGSSLSSLSRRIGGKI